MALKRRDPRNKDLPTVPPDDLPRDLARFWSASANLDDLSPPPAVLTHPALRHLGLPPFPRSGFPLLGYLASVYEHVSNCARDALNRERRP